MNYEAVITLLDSLGLRYHAYTCYSTDGMNTPLKAIRVYDTGRTLFFDECTNLTSVADY